MSIKTRHTVTGHIESTNTTLLDVVQSVFESRQPTRSDDGNEVKYLPSSFDPSNHVIKETSG